MKSPVIVAFAAVILLAGCVSNTIDKGDQRITTIHPTKGLVGGNRDKAVEGYRKAFPCWAESPSNTQGFVLSSVESIDEGSRLQATFTYPEEPEKVAVTFTVFFGTIFWGNRFQIFTEGPERNSPFAEYVIEQHQVGFVRLCSAGEIYFQG